MSRVDHQDNPSKDSMAPLRLRAVTEEVLLLFNKFKPALLRYRVTSSYCKLAFRRRASRTSTLRTLRFLTRSLNKHLARSTRSFNDGVSRRRSPTMLSS